MQTKVRHRRIKYFWKEAESYIDNVAASPYMDNIFNNVIS